MTATRTTGSGAAPVLHLYPVDWVLAAYNVALVPVWLGLVSRSSAALWLALAHAIAACIPLILRRSRLPAGVRAVVDLTPVLALAFFWAELGALQALRGLPPQDALVRRLDLALFGAHWSEVWSRAMPDVWMSELMHFGYFLYYLVLAVPPIVILLLRGRAAFRSMALAVMVTYLSCFLFYLVFPVYGPRAMAAAGAALTPSGGFFHGLVEAARESGDSLGTAFPSSHVAGAVTMAWVAWRFLPRVWAIALSVAAALVTLSTVYTENHYAVDALAGVLWVIPLLGWLVPRLESAWRPRKSPPVTGVVSSQASSPEVSSTSS